MVQAIDQLIPLVYRYHSRQQRFVVPAYPDGKMLKVFVCMCMLSLSVSTYTRHKLMFQYDIFFQRQYSLLGSSPVSRGLLQCATKELCGNQTHDTLCNATRQGDHFYQYTYRPQDPNLLVSVLQYSLLGNYDMFYFLIITIVAVLFKAIIICILWKFLFFKFKLNDYCYC